MLVISNKASDTLKEFLVNEGISFLLSKDNPHLDPRIADHPDLSLFVLDRENILVASEVYDYYRENIKGKNLIRGEEVARKYPKDAIYNLVRFKNFYIHNDFTEENIKKFFYEHDIAHLKVKQGYSRCSTIVLNDCLLTSDYGIYNSLKDRVKVRLLEEDKILLDGFDKGFIGGACGLYDNKLIFTGDIRSHRSFSLIKTACKEEGLDILYPETDLVDLGSLLDIS